MHVKRLALSIISVIVLSVVIGGSLVWDRLCGESSANDSTKIDEMVRPVPVETVRPIEDSCVQIFPGKVRGARRVELAFSVPGLIDDMKVREGERVKKGQVLAKLDQRDYLSRLEVAEARFLQAEKGLARFTALRKDKVIAEVKYEDVKTTYDVLRSERALCRKALEDTVLRAPFDGIVARKYLESHEHVGADVPVLCLQDISLTEVVVQIPEKIIAQGGVRGWKGLEVCFDEDRRNWFHASVREYSAESDRVIGTYDVVMVFAPPEDMEILPGMTAVVRSRSDEFNDKKGRCVTDMRVPVEALCNDGDGQSYVWVIDPSGGLPSRREIHDVSVFKDCLAVRNGLKEGELVAVAGLDYLRDDVPVRPMSDGADGLDG